MNKNVISPDEALKLVRKLITEKISVQATLYTGSGLTIRLKGFVVSVSEPTGVVVSTEHPVSGNKGACLMRLKDGGTHWLLTSCRCRGRGRR
jgi:hypothetical protein